MVVRQDLKEAMAGLRLFADLTPPQLEAVTLALEEFWFNQGQRILRQGFSQPDFFVIIDGEAAVRIGGEDRNRLAKGDFFGEISALLGEPPTADVVALTSLRCASLAGDEMQKFLMDFPPVMYRMLQAEAAKLRTELQWRT